MTFDFQNEPSEHKDEDGNFILKKDLSFKWDELTGTWLPRIKPQGGVSRYVRGVGFVHEDDMPKREVGESSAALVRSTGEIYSKTPDSFNDMMREIKRKSPASLGPTTINCR